jgi:hypothetical protein
MQEAAREASRPRTMSGAIVLYREALIHFAAAYAIGQSTEPPPLPPSMAEALAILDGPLRSAGVRAESLEQVATAAREPPAPSEMKARQVRLLVRAADDVVATARRIASAPSPARVGATRVVRVGAVVLALCLSVYAGVAWLRAPTNLARGKRAFASSIRGGRPEALVNGAIEWGTYSYHSNTGPSWVVIDLGRTYSLDEVRVYNRGDSYLDEGLPLTIASSLDDRSYSDRGSCAEFFTQATPCRVPLQNRKARYVRVSSARYLALTEIEVMGR